MDDNFQDLKIVQLSGHDIDKFIELIKVFEEVFEMKNFSLPGIVHLQNHLSRNDFIVFTACLNGQIIGGLTSYVIDQYYSEKPLAYIYDLAVKTSYQRQGVGKKLISAITLHCTESGFEEVFVQADKVDDYALDFYRSTNVTAEEDVIHFYYALTNEN